MIRFDRVSFTYPDATRPTLRDVDLTVAEGELCLVVGRTGSGKSTFLRTVNGLVPRFCGGLLTGTVSVDGRSTADHPPRELADIVGLVGQDPAAGFVTDTVEEELAYAMGNLGVAPDVMRRRVEDALDLLSLHELRRRPLLSLSGGQQQRVAIGAALTTLAPCARPRRTDVGARPGGRRGRARRRRSPRARPGHDRADRRASARARRAVRRSGAASAGCRRAGRDGGAGGHDGDLAGRAAGRRVGAPGRMVSAAAVDPGCAPAAEGLRPPAGRSRPRSPAPGLSSAPPIVRVEGVAVAYGSVVALRSVDLDLRAGEVLAVMGRNGSGKSTLLARLAGVRAPACGPDHRRRA